MIVEVEGVTKGYDEGVVLDAVSLSVRPGEVFAILGPNGAGKTTLVEIAEGFRRPDGGRVRVFGLDPRSSRRRLLHRVGVMPQDGGVYPGIRVAEALRLFASYYEQPADPRDLLERMGLEHVARQPWRRLSGGEKQRLSLALAVIGRPELAFLDEPTSGMDPRARATTWDVIRRLRDGGVTVILTTHYMDEAEQLADRVAIIDRGRLVALDTPSRLTASDAAVIRFFAPAGLDTAALSAVVGAPAKEERPGEYTVEAASPALLASVAAWLAERDVPLRGLSAGRRSLEDVFLELTDGARG